MTTKVTILTPPRHAEGSGHQTQEQDGPQSVTVSEDIAHSEFNLPANILRSSLSLINSETDFVGDTSVQILKPLNFPANSSLFKQDGGVWWSPNMRVAPSPVCLLLVN